MLHLASCFSFFFINNNTRRKCKKYKKKQKKNVYIYRCQKLLCHLTNMHCTIFNATCTSIDFCLLGKWFLLIIKLPHSMAAKAKYLTHHRLKNPTRFLYGNACSTSTFLLFQTLHMKMSMELVSLLWSPEFVHFLYLSSYLILSTSFIFHLI